MNDSILNKSISCFQKNQNDFAKNHYKEFVLIHDEYVEGFYADQLSAYLSGADQFPKGEFLIRECIKPEEQEKIVFHSRVG